MICPYCGHDNIAGSYSCDQCGTDLAGLDLPTAQSRLQETIMDVPLGKLEPHKPLTIGPDESVGKAIQMMKEKGHGSILVVKKGRLVGIFTERDAVLKLAGGKRDIDTTPIKKVMTPNPDVLTEDDTIAFALNRMSVMGYRHVPIVKDDEPVGFVSVRGILNYISEHALS